MNQTILDGQIEQLISEVGTTSVLESLARVCTARAAQLSANYKDSDAMTVRAIARMKRISTRLTRLASEL